MILRKGVESRAATRTVKTIRRATATPAPRIMPMRRLSSRQAAAGHRDDDGIVAGQDDVDPDDAEQFESLREESFHDENLN